MGGRGRAAAEPAAPFTGPVRHVYVHVPFCTARCDYCDFYSTVVPVAADGSAGEATGRAARGGVGLPARDRTGRLTRDADALFDGYVAAVAAEWERERAAHGVRRLETLYLGGGTPALLGTERLDRLVAAFAPWLTRCAEVTVETNPDEADDAFAVWAGTRGVRVSLGVQSFVPRLRTALGRRPAADPAAAARRLRAAGVRDLSVDLMHGIPGQTTGEVDADLAAVGELEPDHVSWYELDVIAGTPLARRLARAGRGEAQRDGEHAAGGAGSSARGEDERAALYRHVVRGLECLDYRWYEVSNFARPGRRARHNTAYWRARPYLGLGPGAVSTVGGLRWRNVPDVSAYTRGLTARSPEASEAPAAPPRETEALDDETLARERLFLAARCGLPVPLAAVAPAIDPDSVASLSAAGLLSLHSGTIRVTRKGRYVANEVCVRLFRA